jgi:hypothetical protein
MKMKASIQCTALFCPHPLTIEPVPKLEKSAQTLFAMEQALGKKHWQR